MSDDKVPAGSSDFLRSLPKTELHLHLEGSVGPAVVARLADRHQSDWAGLGPELIRDKLMSYKDFDGFLKSYGRVCEHLREPQDYVDALEALAGELRSHSVRYAEVIYTPSIPWKAERDGQAILEALLETSRRLDDDKQIRIRWILDCVRQWGVEPAQRTAELAAAFQGQGVVALGIGGDELSLPMSDFRDTFQWAKAHQLHIHAHAGEIGGPEQIWEAVRTLGANRIGHGIQAARDPELMDYLKEHAIGLDVCLTSNVRTGAWKPLSQHPLPLLLKRGVAVSLNTDDPALFETDLTSEYAQAVKTFGLDRVQVERIILHGVSTAFLDHDDKMALMDEFQSELSRREARL